MITLFLYFILNIYMRYSILSLVPGRILFCLSDFCSEIEQSNQSNFISEVMTTVVLFFLQRRTRRCYHSPRELVVIAATPVWSLFHLATAVDAPALTGTPVDSGFGGGSEDELLCPDSGKMSVPRRRRSGGCRYGCGVAGSGSEHL